MNETIKMTGNPDRANRYTVWSWRGEQRSYQTACPTQAGAEEFIRRQRPLGAGLGVEWEIEAD